MANISIYDNNHSPHAGAANKDNGKDQPMINFADES